MLPVASVSGRRARTAPTMLRLATGFSACLILLMFVSQTQARDDERCRCVCPPISNVFKNSTGPSLPQSEKNRSSSTSNIGRDRTVYMKKDVMSDDCKCENVLDSWLPNGTDFPRLQDFCLRCQCVFEKRNTTTQKVVVIFMIVVMAMLFVYALFLIVIEPLFQRLLKSQRRSPTFLSNINYEGPTDDRAAVYTPADAEEESNRLLKSEDDRTAASGAAAGGSGVVNNLVNRVRQTQEKWKEDVHEQRQNIFTRHNLLN